VRISACILAVAPALTVLSAPAHSAPPGLGDVDVAEGSAGLDDPYRRAALGAGFGARGRPKPPPLHVDYATYGVAVTADIMVDAGATCRRTASPTPCILGSGGGLVLRGGYRSPGPWYIGGAYQFSKTDSSNLYRLATLQQLRAEMRYSFDLGYRTSPYVTWGLGGVVYGNEFGAETGGGTAFGGVGVEMQLSRLVQLGMAIHYQPMIFAAFIDTANYVRDPGLAQFFRIEFQVEVRSELSRN
jgi:opacity protein-like surface antigen